MGGRGGGIIIDNGFRSPTPKLYSNEQTFIKEDTPALLNPNDQTDHIVDEMKKGSSNILVRLNDIIPIGCCEIKATVE